MNELSLSLLGPFRAALDSEPLGDFRTRKVQALLAYLAAEPQGHSRDMLMELLWPGLPEKSARSNLRQILYYLRRDIPDVSGKDGAGVPVIIANRQEIQFNPQAAATVDTWQFESLLNAVHAHEHLDLFLCRECAQRLEQAVATYRGDFLWDFYLDDSNEFEEWAQARREYFRRKALDALAILTTIAIRARDFPTAQSYAEKQLEVDNLRESAYRQLMEVLARSGRREQALAVYDTCRRVLAEELGMAPAARTTEYYERIVGGDLRFDRFERHCVRGYELKEQIGEGSYGAIYRAVQPAILRQVAIKVIRPRYADDADFIRRFEAEAQTVARLEHPYIVPLYDYWRDPQGAYLVMRYMRGGSLLEALQGGPWDAERAASMVDQLAGALAIAHRQGVIHRDIKPGNILLDETGNAYLADFGIAKDLTSERRLTAAGAVVGTLDYVSPEQIRSETVTAATDIYSLGAVLYETLTGEKPFGDASVAQLLYSQLHEAVPLVAATRPDVPPEVDAVLQKATAKTALERYASVPQMASAFRNAVRGLQPEYEEEGKGPAFIPALRAVYNPYKGLQAFQEADADDFFGRDALVQQLLARLRATVNEPESRFLALVGPSGSGKSSAVKAGLLPALRQGAVPGSEKWFIAEMVPGSNPLHELEQALLSVAVEPPVNLVDAMRYDRDGILRTIRRILPAEREPQQGGAQLLLIVDQFEELFTLVEDEEERVFFLDSLLAALQAARSPLRVLVTLRADMYDRPLQYQEWGQLLKQNTEIVLPLNRTELNWAVREPARRVAVQLEEGLAAAIVADVADQPGALPLLQYAMTELFERREGQRLTRAQYERLGGVQGALGRRAEALYGELDESGQQIARQIFLRLITLGEGTEDTRRRVLRAELEALTGVEPAASAAPSPVATVLDRFGAARFLTFDRDPLTRAPTVEVAHEALLREWPRLRGWLAESRDDVRLQRLLAQAAAEWEAAGRESGFLLHEARLDQFVSWAKTTPVALTAGEQVLVAASTTAREKRMAVEEERRQRELQAARDLAGEQQKRAEEQTRAAHRLRRRAVYLGAALLVAGVLAVLAFAASRQSSLNAVAAQDNARRADANANAAATNAAESAANASLAQTREAEEALQRSAAEDARATAEAAEASAVRERELAEEQARLATSRELSLAAYNVLDADPELSILLALQALETAYTEEAEEALHRALQSSRTRLALTGHEGLVTGLAYRPDGRQLATASDTARLWDVTTGAELFTLPFSGELVNDTLLYDEDGSTLAVVSRDEDWQRLLITAWDARTAAPVVSMTLPITTDQTSDVALSPDLTLLAVGYESGLAALWDVHEAEQLLTFPAHADWIVQTQFSPDGARLLLGSANGELSVWDVPASVAAGSVQPVATLTAAFAGEGQGISRATFSDDGQRIAVGSAGLVEVWDLSAPARPQYSLAALSNIIYSLDFNADGSLLQAGDANGTAVVWEMSEGRLLYTLAGHDGGVWDAEFSPDSRLLATAGGDATARIWDAAPVADGEITHFPTDQVMLDFELSPDGQTLALGGLVGPAVLFEAESGERLLELAGDPGTAVYRTAFHPDDRRIATVGEDNVIRIWDWETGEVLRSWTGHDEGGSSGGGFFGTLDVVFSPDGSRLATAGTDGVAKVWDAESGEELLVLAGHTAGLHSIAYSPDGRWIATSSDYLDSTVKVWDADSGAEVYSLEANPVRVWALAFSPDSRLLATGGFLGVVKVWDLASGEERYSLPSQVSTVSTIRFTSDGMKMVTNGEALRVWDVNTGTELLVLGDGRSGFDIAPGDRHLYAGDRSDGVVRIYALTLDLLVTTARERLTRWWTEEECRQYLHRDTCPPE